MSTPRGNIGRVIPIALIEPRNALTLAVQPTGNGPISNSAPFVASAEGIIILLGFRGARMNSAKANSSGIWSFYDLSPGTYYATEAGVSRQWVIVVAGDLSFTVTPVTSSFPRTRAYASA
jgi:hypothetical protein